ncbi:hypothetical protein B0H13DRAFT_2268025 [Mycena leptocephala]|nr:hypothetical protein B0H13DRAFT_2268025 [Mycena leptocephala]
MSIPERSFLAVLRLVRIKDRLFRPNWDSWNPEYNGSNPAIPVPRELNPSARFRGQDDYIETCRMDAKDSSGTQGKPTAQIGPDLPVRIPARFKDTDQLGSNGRWLKDIAGFWVGFCFWELNGFYSVTGHRYTRILPQTGVPEWDRAV